MKDSKFVKAKFDYITNESTLLSFKQGDVIKLVDKGNLAEGWLYGELSANEGYFPAEYVTDMNEVGWNCSSFVFIVALTVTVVVVFTNAVLLVVVAVATVIAAVVLVAVALVVVVVAVIMLAVVRVGRSTFMVAKLLVSDGS